VVDCFKPGRRQAEHRPFLAAVRALHADATTALPTRTTPPPTTSARRHWQQALDRYAELGVPEADEVRAALDA
jgi:hypothetical protein